MKSNKVRRRRPKRPERVVLSLTAADRRRISGLLSKGEASVRVFKRARILQMMDEGHSASAAASAVGIDAETARRIGRRYLEGGFERAIFDAPRPGAAWLLDSRQESQIVAMVCSKPPKGFSRWSISLIAKEVVARGIIDSVSDETIRQLLHRHELKPWREKNVVRGKT